METAYFAFGASVVNGEFFTLLSFESPSLTMPIMQWRFGQLMVDRKSFKVRYVAAERKTLAVYGPPELLGALYSGYHVIIQSPYPRNPLRERISLDDTANQKASLGRCIEDLEKR